MSCNGARFEPLYEPRPAKPGLARVCTKATYSGHALARWSVAKVLRKIEVLRPDDAPRVLVTNDLHSPAAEIARLYKQR